MESLTKKSVCTLLPAISVPTDTISSAVDGPSSQRPTTRVCDVMLHWGGDNCLALIAPDFENSTTSYDTIFSNYYNSSRTGGNPAAFLEHFFQKNPVQLQRSSVTFYFCYDYEYLNEPISATDYFVSIGGSLKPLFLNRDDRAFGRNARGQTYPRRARCPHGGWSEGGRELRSK